MVMPGDDVAALCDDVADDNWILAEVYLYNSNTNKYQVTGCILLFNYLFNSLISETLQCLLSTASCLPS